MATEYVFNTGATLEARVALKADTVTGDLAIESWTVADAKIRNHTLTAADKANILNAWRIGEERVYALGIPSNNYFMVFSKSKTVSFPVTVEADEDSATDGVSLTEAQTALFMGWIDQYSI